MHLPATSYMVGAALLAGALGGALGASAASAGAQQQPHDPTGRVPATRPSPPPPPAPFPLAQEARLSNGVRLVVVERPGAPMVELALSMPGGAPAREPVGMEGVSQVAAMAITRGAGHRSAEEFAAAAAQAGGSIGAASDRDALRVSASVQAREAALAFELVADAAVRPTFPETEVQHARIRAIASLPPAPPPSVAAARALGRMMDGDARPFGRSPTVATLRGLTRDDLVSYRRTHLRPQGALLVVAGDITLAQARALAERALAGWTGAAPAEPPKPAGLEILIVEATGAPRASAG